LEQKALLPFSLLGNATWFAHYLKCPRLTLEIKEHFVKQSYRNRCTIVGANGPLDLIVPIEHGRKEHVPMEDVQIAYHHDWRREHWQSLVSAYRSSPYFEFYEPELEPIWFVKHERLVGRSTALLDHVLQLLKEEPKHTFSAKYEKEPDKDVLDLRNSIHPKKPWPTAVHYPKYPQVFEDRQPFMPDLSVLDLLFNVGPEASGYLRSLPISG